MRKSAFFVGGLMLALAVVACAPGATPTPSPPGVRAEEFQYADTASKMREELRLPGPAGPNLPRQIPGATFSNAPAPMPTAAPVRFGAFVAGPDRMIVRNGSLALVVESVASAAEEVARIATDVGGFLVSSSVQGEGKATSARLTVRVPVDRFDEAMARLRKLVVRVVGDSTSGQDVTQEYSDLQAQVRNLEAAEAQLQRIMDRADKVDEVLQVYRELINIRGQIETAKGRAQYLERTAAMSAINVDLFPASSPEPLVRPGWSAAGTTKDAVRGVTAWGQGLVSALIWVGVFSPFWGAGFLALAVVALVARRRLKGGPGQS